MTGVVVTAQHLIPASDAEIFELLACPARHPVIDGSGSVLAVRGDSPARLTLGARFAMSMRAGIAYSTVNTVTEFEEARCIAWQTRLPGPAGRFTGGRVWRYELEPRDAGTLVRETWDLSGDRQRGALSQGSLPRRTLADMERTLRHIEAIVTRPSS